MVRSRSRSEGVTGLLDAEEISFPRLGETLTGDAEGRERMFGQPVRDDEFTCARCHLVLHAARRAGPDVPLCVECAPRAAATR
jgi:hypothetical protein